MSKQNAVTKKTIPILVIFGLILLTLAACQSAPQDQTRQIAILISGDIRLDPVNGLKAGLAELGYIEGEDVQIEIYNADGDRAQLPILAQEIVASKPAIAIAGGGIEADALKATTEGTDIPVVFLAVASAVERGLGESMRSSGNNLTGIDTNDTPLTAKRLELITKMFPETQRVLILNVPSITASADSTQSAQEAAPGLGLELVVIDVETEAEIRAAAESISVGQVDAILILPVAPIWQLMQEVLYPVSIELGIPIFGVNRDDLSRGAVASYAASRYAAGMQAARLVDRIFQGVKPTDLPIESPEKLEFLVNGTVLNSLGLTLPDDAWSLVDEVLEEEIN